MVKELEDGWGLMKSYLPEMFSKLGSEGWEMISHVVNQDVQQNGVTFHYYNFKREI